MRILITLCGRGGSKGVPGKNIRPLCGVPMVHWSLFDAFEAFKSCGSTEVTVVADSDSSDILDVASSFSPEVLCHLRPSSLGGDSVPKMSAIRRAFLDVESDMDVAFDAVIDLDITSPLREDADIRGCLDVLLAGDKDVVFSVVPARRSPYFNMVERGEDGKVSLSKPSSFVSRQEAPSVYEMNASIYAYRASVLRDTTVVMPTALNSDIWVMKDHCVLDIDSEEDFSMMELVSRNLASQEDSYYQRRFLNLEAR